MMELLKEDTEKLYLSLTYRYVGLKSGLQGDKIITVFNMTENKC